MLAWIVGGALAMYFEAIAIAAEIRDFPGGGKALEQFIMPTLEAMRILRWPADRIDTLGGYLTYHNVTLVALFLAIFAGLQGSKSIRHLEESQSIEVYLATGVSRAKLLWSRFAGFTVAQLAIGFGLGAGTALAFWALDEPMTSESFVTLMAVAICTLPCFGLGMLLSQFFDAPRLASGISTISITSIYVLGNIAEKYEWLGWIQYFSPFYYANLSRPLIPEFEANYDSWALTAVVSAVLVWVSGVLFTKRDVGAASFQLKIKKNVSGAGDHEAIKLRAPRSLIGDMLWRQRVGLGAWIISTGAFLWLFIALMPSVMDVWKEFSFLEQFAAAGFGETAEQQYLAIVFELLPPFLAGFIVMQSSRWTSDLVQGRVQLWLSTPLTMTELMVRRFLATQLGSQLIIVSSLLLVSLTSQSQLDFDPEAIARVYVVASLMAAALTALALLLNSLMHTLNSTVPVSIYIGASWMIVFMAPYLEWPEWTQRLSIFDAFAHPYIEWPSLENFLVISLMIIISLPLAIAISNKRAKVI